MKKLHVDGHVHLQHQMLQDDDQQQAKDHLVLSLEKLARRLHASVQPGQSWPCSRMYDLVMR